MYFNILLLITINEKLLYENFYDFFYLRWKSERGLYTGFCLVTAVCNGNGARSCSKLHKRETTENRSHNISPNLLETVCTMN